MIESETSSESLGENDVSTVSCARPNEVKDDDFVSPKSRKSSNKAKNDSLLETDDESEAIFQSILSYVMSFGNCLC